MSVFIYMPSRFLQASHMLMGEKPQVTTREIHDVAEAKCCRVIAKHSCLQEQSLERKGEQRGDEAGTRGIWYTFSMLASISHHWDYDHLNIVNTYDHKDERMWWRAELYNQENTCPWAILWVSNGPLGYVGCVVEFLFLQRSKLGLTEANCENCLGSCS